MLALAEAAGHELWADAYVIEEARRNLAAKSPTGLTVLHAMSTRIKIGGLTASGPLPPDAQVLPEKDKPIIASAIHHRCDFLVTGDRTHLGPLYGKAVHGVTVVSPAMLAKALLG